MARRDGDFLKGVLGNVILRVLNGKQVMQRRIPKGSAKHTSNTKWCSETFGMAASLSGKIRHSLASRIMRQADTLVSSRLNGIVYPVILQARDRTTGICSFDTDSFESLKRFNFNVDKPFQRLMAVEPVIHLEGDKLTVAFPKINVPQSLKFPYQSERCKMSVALSLFRLADGKMLERCITQQQILLRPLAPFAANEFIFIVPNGCLYIVTLWLEYETRTSKGIHLNNMPKLYSGSICEARIAPGQFIEDNQYLWTDMISL
jgi:hypothetical protein